MITATVKGAQSVKVTGRLTQWDVGQEIRVEGLSVDGTPYARLSVARKSYSTITVECEESDGALAIAIPDTLLTFSGQLVVTIVDDRDSSARAVASFEVSIDAAPKPADYVPGTAALVTIAAVIKRVEQAEKDALDAVGDAVEALAIAQEANATAQQTITSVNATNSSVKAAEESRVQAEQARESAETLRDEAEQARKSAETARANAESARVEAENQRAQAETQRASDFTAAQTERAEAFAAAQTERAQAFDAAQSQRALDFSTAMGEWGGRVSTAVSKAEVATDSANAAATNAEAHAGNYLRGEETGALVHVEDAWPSPVRGMKVYGKSEQASTTGKNLFDASVIASTGDLMNNADGSFTVNGYSIDTEKKLKEIAPGLIAGQKYSFSFETNGVSAIYLQNLESWLNRTSKTVTEKMLDANVFLYGKSDGTKSTIKNIQIELGSTATSYEPYSGGKPSPSPEYPQEIKSIGAADVVSAGKNLMPPLTEWKAVTAYYDYRIKNPFKEDTYVSGVVNGLKWIGKVGNYALCRTDDSGNVTDYLFGYTSETTVNFTNNLLKAGGYIRFNSDYSFDPTSVEIAMEATMGQVAYSPYTGSTYPVSLTAEDGTAYELRSLPEGTRDEVGIVDGRWVLDIGTGRTSTAATDGVTGTVGVDVLSSTGEIADGADVVYKLSERVTIDLGPADTPLLPETVSNVWAVSEPSTEVVVTYDRDVTAVIGRLEPAVSTLATN